MCWNNLRKDETSPYPGNSALLPGNSAKCFGKRRKFDSCVEGLGLAASAIVDAWVSGFSGSWLVNLLEIRKFHIAPIPNILNPQKDWVVWVDVFPFPISLFQVPPVRFHRWTFFVKLWNHHLSFHLYDTHPNGYLLPGYHDDGEPLHAPHLTRWPQLHLGFACKMLGKSDRKIFSQMVVPWWCTTAKSTKNTLKQIQVLFTPTVTGTVSSFDVVDTLSTFVWTSPASLDVPPQAVFSLCSPLFLEQNQRKRPR